MSTLHATPTDHPIDDGDLNRAIKHLSRWHRIGLGLAALITFALEPRAPGEDPCGGPLKIFDGRQLTHLHLKNAGVKAVKSDAWRGEAIECHVTMDKVAGYKKGEADNDNLTGIDGPLRMYLAPMSNGATVPVRIEADTDQIGKVVLQASVLQFEPILSEEAAADRQGG